MLLGVDVGGTFTDAVLVDAGGRPHRQGTHNARRPVGRREWPPSSARSSAAGAQRGRRRGLRPRHDGGHQRAAGGHGRAHRARRHRGLHRRRRARPPGARASSTGCAPRTRRRSTPPERRFAARERTGPDGVLRAARRPRRAASTRSPAPSPRRWRSVCCTASANPAHECALVAAALERLGRAGLRVLRDPLLRVPRVRAGGDDRGQRLRRAADGTATSGGAWRRRLGAGLVASWLLWVRRRRAGRSRVARRREGRVHTVLSGPAGGVAGAALLAARRGGARHAVLRHGRHVVRRVRRRGRPRAGDRRRARSAAGRSRCRCSTSTRSAPAAARSAGGRGRRAARGPAQRGRRAGPACYGRGGDRAHGHRRQIRAGPPERRRPLAGDVALDGEPRTRPSARWPMRSGSTSRDCAEGIVRVANTEMVRALRVMTVERGVDPRRFALLAFGGAGPLHAAAIARSSG